MYGCSLDDRAHCAHVFLVEFIKHVKRNIQTNNPQLKESAYKTYVHSPLVEYAASVWDPWQKKYINKIEMIQQGTLEDRKRDDSETVSSLLTEALNVDVEIENVFRLGAAPRNKEKSRPIRFTVTYMDNRRRILDSSKNLKNVEGYSNV